MCVEYDENEPTFVNAFIKKHQDKKVAFIDCSKRFNEINDLYFKDKADFYDVLNRLCAVDLLVLDDIGCSKITALEEQILRTIINTRLLNGKATIYTSTAIDEDLQDNIGLRLANMVLDTSTIVELTNTPQRKPINII